MSKSQGRRPCKNAPANCEPEKVLEYRGEASQSQAVSETYSRGGKPGVITPSPKKKKRSQRGGAHGRWKRGKIGANIKRSNHQTYERKKEKKRMGH